MAPPFNLLTPARKRWALVLGLTLGVVVLTLSLVGLANVGAALTRASRTLSADVPQIGAEQPTLAAPRSVVQATADANVGAPLPGPRVIAAPLPAPALASASAVEATAESSDGGAAPAGRAGDFAQEEGAAASGGEGGSGSARPAEDLAAQLAVLAQTTSVMCGPNTCNVGQVCCNWSCGICAEPGVSCSEEQCAGVARPPTSFRCGSALCSDGQVCCNASCGICAAPGASCSSAPCP